MRLEIADVDDVYCSAWICRWIEVEEEKEEEENLSVIKEWREPML